MLEEPYQVLQGPYDSDGEGGVEAGENGGVEAAVAPAPTPNIARGQLPARQLPLSRFKLGDGRVQGRSTLGGKMIPSVGYGRSIFRMTSGPFDGV